LSELAKSGSTLTIVARRKVGHA